MSWDNRGWLRHYKQCTASGETQRAGLAHKIIGTTLQSPLHTLHTHTASKKSSLSSSTPPTPEYTPYSHSGRACALGHLNWLQRYSRKI